MYRYWDGQSWSEQTTSDPSAPPPGPAGPPPPAPPTQVAPGQYGGQDPYQQQYQSPYPPQPQPGQYGGGGYGSVDPYGQQGYGGGPGGGTGKRVALIALAVLLIAGLAAGGFFGVRALTDDGDDSRAASDTSETTEQTEDAESPTDETENPTESPTESPTDSPTGPTGNECTGGLPTVGGETTQRGRIEGGDLVLAPVTGYTPMESQLISVFTFADEVAATYQQIEENWIAMYAVGALPKANGYTDLAASADQVITCMTESPDFYRNFTERNDLDREEIEVDGHPAYSITTELRIDDPDIQVEGDLARVIVVDTGDEEKFGLYISVVPIGDAALIDQQQSATAEVKVAD